MSTVSSINENESINESNRSIKVCIPRFELSVSPWANRSLSDPSEVNDDKSRTDDFMI